MSTIPFLLDAEDAMEVVRDQLAGILLTELPLQQAFAVTAGKDPLDWTMDVQLERSNPLERWMDAAPGLTAETVPVINISLESATLDQSRSYTPGGLQRYDAIYMIDVISRGITTDVPGGHIPADLDAHLRVHRGVRLVRQILTATIYKRLQLPDIVLGFPHFSNFEYGDPTPEDVQLGFDVWSGRGRFTVPLNEVSPKSESVVLDFIRITLNDEGGLILETDVAKTP